MIAVARKVNWNNIWNQPDYQRTERKFLGKVVGHNSPVKPRRYDSEQDLIELGFTIIKSDDHFHHCELPPGWSIQESGYETNYYDSLGVERLSQFDKWASYDTRHHINIL